MKYRPPRFAWKPIPLPTWAAPLAVTALGLLAIVGVALSLLILANA